MATLIRWRKGINVDIGDFDRECPFTGVRAVGEIDGRRFVQLIWMDESLMNDINLEEYVRKTIKSTKAEDIEITASYVCD